MFGTGTLEHSIMTDVEVSEDNEEIDNVAKVNIVKT